MKIGYLLNLYPEKRCIINKTEAIYIKLVRAADFYFIKDKIICLFGGGQQVNWDVQCAYRPLLKDYKNVDIIHTFNHVVFADIPWVVTFESTVPRNNFTVDRAWEKSMMCTGSGVKVSDSFTLKELDLLASKNCKAIISLSESAYMIQENMLKSIAPEYCERLMSKTVTIHPPQDVLADEEDIHKKFDALSQNDCLEFVFVGGDGFRKGIQQIIDVLSEYEDKYNFRLTVISTMNNGDYASNATKEEQEKYIKIMLEKPWITWYEKLENANVLEIMKNCHIGLLPTFADTYGYSVLEMQACGLPVVTTDIRALPEINNDDIGWVCHLTKDNIGGEAVLDSEEERVKRKEELTIGLQNVFSQIFKMKPEEIMEKGIKSLERIRIDHDPDRYGYCLQKIYELIR